MAPVADVLSFPARKPRRKAVPVAGKGPKARLGPPDAKAKPARKAHSIGVAMAGGNPLAGRHDLDFYATPPAATVALLTRVSLEGPTWEPFVGDGAIAKVLEGLGHEVVGTDIVDRGYGSHGGGHDVLAAAELLGPNVVSNPPFCIAGDVIARLLPLGPRVMAFLLKSTFWQAAYRVPLFRRNPPSEVLALSWRLDFADKGGPTMECSWFVWREGHVGPTTFDVLDKPPGYGKTRPRRATSPA